MLLFPQSGPVLITHGTQRGRPSSVLILQMGFPPPFTVEHLISSCILNMQSRGMSFAQMNNSLSSGDLCYLIAVCDAQFRIKLLCGLLTIRCRFFQIHRFSKMSISAIQLNLSHQIIRRLYSLIYILGALLSLNYHVAWSITSFICIRWLLLLVFPSLFMFSQLPPTSPKQLHKKIRTHTSKMENE